jgi:endonuclease G
MKQLFTITLLVFLAPFVFGQTIEQKIAKFEAKIDSLDKIKEKLYGQKEELQLTWVIQKMNEIALPKNGKKEDLVTHSALILSYNEEHEQANWVMHIITPDIITGNTSRTNDFRPDPLVQTGSSEEKDYFLKTAKIDSSGYDYDGFGFDRGHLAPSADFRWSAKALSESYYYSNMSPQVADFNRGKWAELEGWLREYVETNNTYLVIVTAPVLNANLKKIEKSTNGVSIPEFYVKAVLDVKNNRSIAFYMPNEKIDRPIESFAVSIDSVETILNYDLFSGLADDAENKAEAMTDINYWLTKTEKGDVVAIPKNQLPKDAINTYQTDNYINDGKKHTVCGTVVSTKKHDKGHVFINLDKKFPNQIFAITIFESSIKNFSYEPEIGLINQKVCFTGKITEYNGTASIVVENEKLVKMLGEF